MNPKDLNEIHLLTFELKIKFIIVRKPINLKKNPPNYFDTTKGEIFSKSCSLFRKPIFYSTCYLSL